MDLVLDVVAVRRLTRVGRVGHVGHRVRLMHKVGVNIYTLAEGDEGADLCMSRTLGRLWVLRSRSFLNMLVRKKTRR